MPARVDLARLLRRVRRRLRLWAGIEGAVVGTCVALAFAGARVLAARWGNVPGPGSAAVGLGCALLGAVIGAARRIDLRRCARAIDRAVGGADRNGDRTLAAFALMEQCQQGSAFVEAAIDDAALAARGAGLVARAAPFRRPRGLPMAAALAALAGVATLIPARSVPATPVVKRAERARVPLLNESALRAQRALAADAAAQAERSQDPELARLAREMSRLIEALGAGTLDQAEALDALARLAKEAAEAAEAGRAAERTLEAAAQAFERETQTRALAEAMRSEELDAGKKQAEALAEKSKDSSANERSRLASAMDRAAQASTKADSSEAEDGARRLSSPQTAAPAQSQTGGEKERHLKRLERDLSDGAERCRQDPEACKQALQQLSKDLPESTKEARQSSARDRLGRSAQQLREKLRRQEGNGQGGQQSAEEDFERAAGGMRAMPAGDPNGAPEGQAGMEGAPVGTPSSAGSEAEPVGAGARAQASTDTGEGMGSEAGGDPLGDRGHGNGAHGQQREARLRDGAGPSRAEVIEAGAHKGFARTEYQRVFRDYSAVVEETLDTTAVPPARRYLVRRYFELIRPREGGTHGR